MSLEIVKNPQAHCTLCKQFSYRFVWYPNKHYVAGTQFEIRSHSLRAFLSWRYSRFEITSGDITFRWMFNPTTTEMWHNSNRVLFRARLPYGARKGESIDFDMTVIPPTMAGVDNILSVWTLDADDNFTADSPASDAKKEPHSECCMSVVAGPVERLSIYSRPMPGANRKVRTIVVPEDRFGNPSRFEQPQACKLTWPGYAEALRIHETEILQLPTPTGTARATVSVPMHSLAPNENISNGRRERGRLVVTGNPVWTEAPDELLAAFGEFHWHTDFSVDGQRSIREALRCARDILNMDFAAPGDHNPSGIKWENTVAALEEFNQDDAFATFFGWENSSNQGHENYYFTDPKHPLVCGGDAGLTSGKPDQIIELLRDVHKKNDFITIPHHTNSIAKTCKTDGTPYWHPYSWTSPVSYIRLVEIFQTRGNQERNVYDDAWRGWHQNNGACAQDALALGYKIGFVGGTDNHCGWPGRVPPSEGLGMIPGNSVILTGIWTPRIQRQSVYQSLRDRHTWAVWDTRALVYFTVNGSSGGSEITVSPEEELTAHILLSAEDALQTVELVSEGAIVWQASFDDLDIDIDVPLGKSSRSTHFYLRALQRNGGIIYVSPVFVLIDNEGTEQMHADGTSKSAASETPEQDVGGFQS